MSSTVSDEPLANPEGKHFMDYSVSVADTLESGDEYCPICCNSYRRSEDNGGAYPVKFTKKGACKHIFCRDCVEEWAQVQGRNTCPMCRCVLYQKDKEEEETLSESADLVAMDDEDEIPYGLRGETVETETFAEFTVRVHQGHDAVYTIRTTPGLKSETGWEISPEQWVTTTLLRKVLIAVWNELWERFTPYRHKIHRILSRWPKLRQCYLEKWDHDKLWRILNKELRLQKVRLKTPKVDMLREMWLGYMPVVLDKWILTDAQWMVVDGVLKKMYDLMTLEIWNKQTNPEFPREFLNRRCWDVEKVFKEVDATGR